MNIQSENRDFDRWNILKKKLNQRHKSIYFKTREIWWASLGKNLGHEQDGKNILFERPILIIKKFNLRIFLSIPLTSAIKQSPYYHPYTFQNIQYSAILSQIRLLDSKRLQRKIGVLDRKQFTFIIDNIIPLLGANKKTDFLAEVLRGRNRLVTPL